MRGFRFKLKKEIMKKLKKGGGLLKSYLQNLDVIHFCLSHQQSVANILQKYYTWEHPDTDIGRDLKGFFQSPPVSHRADKYYRNRSHGKTDGHIDSVDVGGPFPAHLLKIGKDHRGGGEYAQTE